MLLCPPAAPNATRSALALAPSPRDGRRVGVLRFSRSDRPDDLLRDVVEAAQGGRLPAVGYAFNHAGRGVWTVVLRFRTAALLNPSPVVLWRNMVSAARSDSAVGVHVAHPFAGMHQ